MPMVIGRRLPPPRSSVDAKMKSDHDQRKANRATVIAEFREIGSTTARKVRQYDAPSSFAASMSSFGMPRMNAVQSMTAKGTASCLLYTSDAADDLTRVDLG